MENFSALKRGLKEELQRKLNLSGVEGLSGFAEAGAIQVDIGEIEVHLVQQVKKFDPELQPRVFRDGESEILQE